MFSSVLSITFSIVICFKFTTGCNVANEMALVVYDPPKIFDKFQVGSREFEFADRILNISQDWEKNGVAAVVWDAAVVLAKYLEDDISLSGQKVIELGAGTGLVGLVAGILGAQVTITDRKSALKIAEENIEQNSEQLIDANIEVRELEWGQNISGSFHPPFDLILGADIIYIEDTFNDLLKTIHDLSDFNTKLLLSCKIRYERDERFLKSLEKTFNVKQVVYDEHLDIFIYEARKKYGH